MQNENFCVVPMGFYRPRERTAYRQERTDPYIESSPIDMRTAQVLENKTR